jgi:magnesium transporter
MADLSKQIAELLEQDPLQQLETVAALSQGERVGIVLHLFDDHDLGQLKKVFQRIYPSQLAALLQDLDRGPYDLVFKWAGDEQRLGVMLHLFAKREFHDLHNALRRVDVAEVAELLTRVPQSSRRDVFKLATPMAQVDVLVQLQESENGQNLRGLIEEMEPADIADLLEELESDDRSRILNVLAPKLQAESLVELKPVVVQEIMRSLAVDRLVGLFQLMAADDIAFLLSQLESAESDAILCAMDMEQRDEVRELLSYDEDSAGTIMTPETCSMPHTATVAETRRALGRIADDSTDPILYVFVTDKTDKILEGVVPVIKLINAAPGKTLGDICDRDVIYATPDEDQEEIARRFRRYNIWVMPVVDEDKRLIGRITVDDVIDVVHEEADEDLAHLVGAPDIEDEVDAPLLISRKRLPWLLITMFAGLLNGFIINRMTNLTNIVVLTALAPAILAMGGNTGMQSNAVCIRGIALGNEKYSSLFSIVWREIRVGATLGIVCGALAGATVYGGLWGMCNMQWLDVASLGALTPAKIGIVVGISMFSAMTFASSFGSITPIVLHRLGADPAVASGPFVTTSSDLSAALIYLGICATMFRFLSG